MKKILLTVISALTLSATAVAQTAADVGGKYTGKLYINLFDPISDDTEALEGQEVELTVGSAANSIDFALYNFSLGEMALGDIKLQNIGIETDANGTVLFKENPTVELSLYEGQILAEASLEHTTSFVKGNNISVDINVVWINTGAEPAPIYVKFVGVKQESNIPMTDVTPILGTYGGDLFISLMEPINDETEVIEGYKVELTEGGKKGTINFALYDFELAGMQLGDIKLKNIGVEKVGEGEYKFLENPTVNLTLGSGETTIEATASLNISNSYIKGGVLVADLDVMWLNTGDVPVPIYVRFISNSVTGIENVVATTSNNATYTLSGVRVNSTNLPAGIYIVNGKKVLVK